MHRQMKIVFLTTASALQHLVSLDGELAGLSVRGNRLIASVYSGNVTHYDLTTGGTYGDRAGFGSRSDLYFVDANAAYTVGFYTADETIRFAVTALDFAQDPIGARVEDFASDMVPSIALSSTKDVLIGTIAFKDEHPFSTVAKLNGESLEAVLAVPDALQAFTLCGDDIFGILYNPSDMTHNTFVSKLQEGRYGPVAILYTKPFAAAFHRIMHVACDTRGTLYALWRNDGIDKFVDHTIPVPIPTMLKPVSLAISKATLYVGGECDKSDGKKACIGSIALD